MSSPSIKLPTTAQPSRPDSSNESRNKTNDLRTVSVEPRKMHVDGFD